LIEPLCLALFIIITTLALRRRIDTSSDYEGLHTSNAMIALPITGCGLGIIIIVIRIIYGNCGNWKSELIILGIVQFFISAAAGAWANIVFATTEYADLFPLLFYAEFSFEIIASFFWLVLTLRIAQVN